MYIVCVPVHMHLQSTTLGRGATSTFPHWALSLARCQSLFLPTSHKEKEERLGLGTWTRMPPLGSYISVLAIRECQWLERHWEVLPCWRMWVTAFGSRGSTLSYHWALWLTAITPALRRLRQKAWAFGPACGTQCDPVSSPKLPMAYHKLYFKMQKRVLRIKQKCKEV